MKILVGIKRVIDYNVRVQVNRDGTGVVKDGVKMSINPFDEIAVEEALRVKERGDAAEVIVVSIGPEAAQQQLRTALAMGADRAILYQADEEVQPLAAARALLEVVKAETPAWCCSASRPSTTTSTRSARCSPRCGTARRPPSSPRWNSPAGR
jgi:electron transfer flavoprotein beta subunit